MKNKLCLFIFMVISITGNAKNIVTFFDSSNKSPVVGASLISSNGLIIGFTDKNGRILVEEKDYPLSFRCLGYESVTITAANDTVFVVPTTYSLAEVIVTPKDRPITRVLTYAREYCTGTTPTDTLQLYGEYMLEFFFADGKVKGYKKSYSNASKMAYRSYGRISNTHGLDSVMRVRAYDDITNLSFLQIVASVPYEIKEETDAMKGGVISDTIQGKYFPKYIYKKTDKFFTVDHDRLSDYKNHSLCPWFLKILGLAINMQDANETLIYNLNESGRYELQDFIYSTYNLHLLGKGLKKMLGIKGDMDIYCYIEQYPVEIEHITVDELEELKKGTRNRCEDFQIPENAQPLIPTIKKMVERIDKEIPLNSR